MYYSGSLFHYTYSDIPMESTFDIFEWLPLVLISLHIEIEDVYSTL